MMKDSLRNGGHRPAGLVRMDVDGHYEILRFGAWDEFKNLLIAESLFCNLE